MELQINTVGKKYRRNFWGLRNFSLEIGSGVLGLLGPNGAGKSTLMRIIATLTDATEGNVMWNNVDIARAPNQLRETLGYLPQDFGVYPNLNAYEFLEYIAAVKGLDCRMAHRRIDSLSRTGEPDGRCETPDGRLLRGNAPAGGDCTGIAQ